jgi:hypothetical protein
MGEEMRELLGVDDGERCGLFGDVSGDGNAIMNNVERLREACG